MIKIISADFESFSRVDINKVGTSRYAEDPTTDVLCLAYAYENEEPDLWIPGSPAPHLLFEMLQSPDVYLSAFNALFEMQMWEEVCHKRMGWPRMPVEKFMDTQADALALGLPASLEEVALVLGTIQRKDPVGKRLIAKLCKPVKPTKSHLTDRWTKDEAMDDYLLLYAYCRQDVRVERDVARKLHYRATMPGHPERRIWLATTVANRRGIPVDTLTVSAINNHITTKTELLTREMQELTGGAVEKVTQKARVQTFVNSLFPGPKPFLTDMQGATLVKAAKRKDITELAKKILSCYVLSNYSSIAKFKKMSMQLCKDGTIKDNHRYHGAATGRDAGMGVQIQNLPRAAIEEVEFAIEMIREHPLDEVEMLFGNILELASAMCRPVLAAPHGFKFLNADLKQIEARMTAWVAKEEHILQAYRDGRDAYKDAAALMYHIPYEEVSKVQRQAGKISTLACCYRGGKAALQGMADNYGIVFKDDEAEEIVNAFRASRSKLVKTWDAFGVAAQEAVLNPGSRFTVSTNELFSFVVLKDFLFMHMPNGRVLSFPHPRWELWMMPWGKEKMTVTHTWVNTQKGNKWERRGLGGASFMQSAVQGLSRDVLMEAVLRLEDAGFPHIFRVHDEETACVPDDPSYDLDTFARIFEQVPAWCESLPVECDPWENHRYHK